METISAYCTACDTQLEVRIPEEGAAAIEPGDVDCPHADLCEPADCVLSAGGTPLREALEWLPAGAGAEEDRDLEGASRLVERARRTSLAREIRRWRRWWGGR